MMPVITIEGPKLTKEQKQKLSFEVADSASKIMKIDKEHILILIKENDHDNVSQGGILISEIIKNQKKED